MSDSPSDFDFQLLPDWVKEPQNKNRYAHWEEDSRGRHDDFRGHRPRPDRRDDKRHGAKPKGPGDRKAGPDRRDGAPRRHDGSRLDRGQDRGRDRSARPSAPKPQPQPQAPPVQLDIKFVPEEAIVEALIRQIKNSTRAYPLFGLARMFLDRPERHRVTVHVATEGGPQFFQLGPEGAISFDRANLERSAFEMAGSDFYTEETTVGEPPKGNFSNVARCRLTGTLLGPTNYHGYQPALRKLYEERFSRRMSFGEFQREIEIVTAPDAIEAWKDAARSVTTWTSKSDGQVFRSRADAELHFRQHHLPTLVRAVATTQLSGPASRDLHDRRIANQIRQAWEKERSYPSAMVNQLRPHLLDAGLHIFKHRKRMLYVSTIRLARPRPDEAFAAPLVAILQTIEATPHCTRKEIAAKLAPGEPDSPERTTLVANLHWLIESGHVIEFHDGTLDLPLPPAAAPAAQPAAGPAAEAAASESPSPETPTAETANPEPSLSEDPIPEIQDQHTQLPDVPVPEIPTAHTPPLEEPEPLPAAQPESEPAPDASSQPELSAEPLEEPPVAAVAGEPSPALTGEIARD
jgi:hypothetical protein